VHRRGNSWRDERGDEEIEEARLGKGDEDRDEKDEEKRLKRGKRARD